MPRPPAIDQDKKTALILDVLAGRCNLAQAALRAGVSAQAVSNWRRQFIEAGNQAMQSQCASRANRDQGNLRLRQLFREVQQLKIALAEAHLAIHASRNPSRFEHGARPVPTHPAGWDQLAVPPGRHAGQNSKAG